MFTPEMLRHSPKSKAVKLDCSQKHTDFKGMFSARKRDTHLKPSSETRLRIVARNGMMNSPPSCKGMPTSQWLRPDPQIPDSNKIRGFSEE